MIRLLTVIFLVVMGACAVADDSQRTVSVSGVGSSEIAPDRATVNMSIMVRKKTLENAQAGAAKVTADVLKMADRLDIDREHINTTGASVQPDYRWNREREEQELRGYIAQRQIVIDVRDLDILGQVVEGAVAAGVNQVSPPQLDSGKRREAYRAALARAAEDARASAAQLAKSLGARLGPVIEINTGNVTQRPPSPVAMMRSASAESDASATYNAADLNYNATVNVTFALEVD